jgi:hypothetical protein
MGRLAFLEVSDAKAWILWLTNPLARGERGKIPLVKLSRRRLIYIA